MSNELLIEVGPHETRVAILEDGRVVEVHIERATEPGVVGNIYKGRVSRVVPGIQAAFVDIGLQRDAFLFGGDLQRTQPLDPAIEDDQERRQQETRPIADLVQEGQDLLVQVVKEPLPGKGARITSQVSLPGRLAVLLPGAGGLGISRRISSPEERQRLAGLLEALMLDGDGIIVRTAGANRQQVEFRRELDRLQTRWQEVKKRSAGISAPGLVSQETGLAERTARDLVNEEFSEVWIEGDAAYAAIDGYLGEVDRQMVDRLRLYQGDDSLFEHRGVNAAIVKALCSRVWLDSGGFIIINPTEALVAIDVNSGRNTEAAALEATAFETNLEAAVEVARQIRLRDLAGIIVVDFIDMTEPEHRAELVSRFASALSQDRTRTQISQVSDFGLIAVTRKRMRGGLRQRLTRICPCCAGEGRVADPETVGIELDRELRRRALDAAPENLRIRLHPQTKKALEKNQRHLLAAIEKLAGGRIDLEADGNLGFEEFEIETP